MKPTTCALLASLVLVAPILAFADEGVESLSSRYTVLESATRIRDALEIAGMRVSTIVDPTRDPAFGVHDRDPSQLLIVGDPKARVQLMRANPLLALDLPTKILVWKDANEVKASFDDPDFLRMRYSLTNIEMEYFWRIESAIEHALE
jgi:uncharacterized protein (DUF302 family)